MSQTIDNLRNNFQTKLNEIASHLDTVKTHLEGAAKEAETAYCPVINLINIIVL